MTFATFAVAAASRLPNTDGAYLPSSQMICLRAAEAAADKWPFAFPLFNISDVRGNNPLGK